VRRNAVRKAKDGSSNMRAVDGIIIYQAADGLKPSRQGSEVLASSKLNLAAEDDPCRRMEGAEKTWPYMSIVSPFSLLIITCSLREGGLITMGH